MPFQSTEQTRLLSSDWHVHTALSQCADRDMEIEAIVAAAAGLGLRTIALTNHHHPDEDDRRLRATLAQRDEWQARGGGPVRVVVGAEFSAYGIGLYSDTPETNRLAEFRLYAPNHYHHPAWERPADTSPRGYAEHALAVIRATILSGRADCLAHPFTGDYLRGILESPLEVTRVLADEELAGVLELARTRDVAMELNAKAVIRDPDFARRFWRIGRQAGVRFLFGSDAHRPAEIGAPASLAEIRAILDSAGVTGA